MKVAFRFRASVALFAVIALLSLPLMAQYQSDGRIAGIVKDTAGAVIKGAKVTVKNQDTGLTSSFTTTGEGTFLAPSLPAGMYTVRIEAAGFTVGEYKDVKVNANQEYSLNASLKVGSAGDVVEVNAGQELVNTTTSEVSHTVSQSQLHDLPLNGRGAIGLLATQSNVNGTNGKTGTTTIAGSLPSWSQVTLDGINVQDIFIRTNALDFIPNRPSTEAVSEFTVTQGAQGADVALGANSVRMVTKSGTNDFHGNAYEYNRNSAFAANTWFNNHNVNAAGQGIAIPFLNRNEYGAGVNGPVMKNRLFFSAYYDALRNHSASAVNQAIPAHDDLLQGVFRYKLPGTQTVQSVNVITGAGLTGAGTLAIDPKIASAFIARAFPASSANNFSCGTCDSTSSLLVNRAGLSRNVAANNDRDVWGSKVNFHAAARHDFEFSFQHVHETTLRSDLDQLNITPVVSNNAVSRLFVGSWKWTVKDNMLNKVTVGSNYSQAPFDSTATPSDGFLFNSGTGSSTTIAGVGLSSTQIFFQPQGRIPTIHQYGDDFSWVRGAHTMNFGGSFQKQNVDSYDYGINPYVAAPIVNFGYTLTSANPAVPASGTAGGALTAGQFPTAISQSDVTAANALRTFLAGIVTSANQQFYVTSPTSGFIPGARNDRNLTLNDLAFYGQDKWRIRPNLTINYGVKWEYLSPYKEINGLQLGPVYADPNNPAASLLNPATMVDFQPSLYNARYNNFGPSVGFAWDPFKDGKTAVRGGYTITYVNDDTFRFAGNAADGNAGLGSGVQSSNLFQTLNSGVAVTTPAFIMPRTLAQQLAVSPTSALFGVDPNVKTPRVHEIAFSIQREIMKNMSLEVRYVGTLGRDLLRGVDLNQTNAGINQAFLNDFAVARSNAFLCAAKAGCTTGGAFNATVTGSSNNMPYFATINNLVANLGASSLVTALTQNAPGAFADTLVQSQTATAFTNARQTFLPNPGIYAADLAENGAFSSYHSMVVEVQKQYSHGLALQGSYTWGKLLNNSPGDTGQTRFDALLDNARPQLEKAPADYDLRQALKINSTYELPFGRGKAFLSNANELADKIIGGWQISGIWSLQSGAPFSILSTRGTFNRAGRSGIQTAVSAIPQNQISQYFGVNMASNGNVYFINPGVTDTTGKAVGPDTLTQAAATNFNQIFFNPTAGNVGNLGLNAFTGPAYTNLDMGISKKTKITERLNMELRMDAFNAPNHNVFFIGNQEVNSTTFGRITSSNNSSRKLQFGARLSF